MGKIRIIDVANHAAVSKSTVSQYLNGRFEYMSADTKERIRQSVEALDYAPNPIARSLKTDRTRTIGVIVRDITGYFTSRILRGIDDYCKKLGYSVLIHNTDFDPQSERHSLNVLKQLRTDGIIFASSGQNHKLFCKEIDSGFPIVQMHMEYEDLNSCIVLSDYRKGCFEATEYLLKLGHRRICFLTQNYDIVKSRYDRYLGYEDALIKHKIPVDKALIQHWHRDSGFKKPIEQILKMKDPPTAFFSMHMKTTVELLKNLGSLEVRIPDDVSIIGFDELPLADMLKVPVTVMSQSPYDIGKEAAKLLIEKIETKDNSQKRIVLPCFLIIRDSCAAPRGH